MRASIYLYTDSPLVLTEKTVADCIALIAPNDSVRISRTIGPANYFSTPTELSDDGFVETIYSPPQDISYQRYSPASSVSSLYRPGSALRVNFEFKEAPYLKELYYSIESAELGGQGFCQAGLTFGPSDLVDYDEEADTAILHAVSQISFHIDWDNYTENFFAFYERFQNSDILRVFQARLESVTGPLKLFLSY